LTNAPLVCKLSKLPLEVTIDSPALQKDDKESNKKYILPFLLLLAIDLSSSHHVWTHSVAY
jgi:hypothetical protein